MIKRLIISVVFLTASLHGSLQACSVYDREETEIGPTRAIKGVCSTDRKPVTCLFKGGAGTTCDGPAGSFTGFDLNELISAACGCSFYQFEYMEQGQVTVNKREINR